MSELFDLDEVSLQCFANKHVYKKYLEKKNPSHVSLVNEETQKKAVIKEEALVDLLKQLIHNTSTDKYHRLDLKYFPFIETCIDHLEKVERHEAMKESGSHACDFLIGK